MSGSPEYLAEPKSMEEAVQSANQKLNLLNRIVRHDILNTITGLMGLEAYAGQPHLRGGSRHSSQGNKGSDPADPASDQFHQGLPGNRCPNAPVAECARCHLLSGASGKPGIGAPVCHAPGRPGNLCRFDAGKSIL